LDAQELRNRTKQFGLRVINLMDALPTGRAANVICRQLLGSATSVGANYRAACRARSRPDFVSKLGIAIEEADESLYWMEVLVDAKIMAPGRLDALMKEGNEIVAILTASAKTARAASKAKQGK
jgi:four helix bundle protein